MLRRLPKSVDGWINSLKKDDYIIIINTPHQVCKPCCTYIRRNTCTINGVLSQTLSSRGHPNICPLQLATVTTRILPQKTCQKRRIEICSSDSETKRFSDIGRTSTTTTTTTNTIIIIIATNQLILIFTIIFFNSHQFKRL